MGLISAIKGHHHAAPARTNTNDSTTSSSSSSSSSSGEGISRTHAAGAAAGGALAARTGASEYCHTQNAPIVQENIRQHQKTEVTPVVDRELEQTVVQQVVQPVQDHVKAEAQHHYQQAQGISRETAEELSSEDARRYQAQREIVTGGRTVERFDQGVVENAPIVKERVNTHVIEEIQPVIERTIDETHVVHTEQPIYEHHTAAPKVAEVRYNAPVSIEEFEKRGGSMTGTGLACERR
jgi:anaerobic ribonucleoside-triphosphate reductase